MPAQALISAVQTFAEREIAPHAAEIDRTGQLPKGLWRKLGEQGITGLAIPEAWGGVEADLATFTACLEIIGGACASTAWTLLAHSACAQALVLAGSEAQKSTYLPALASGQKLGSAVALTEATGGSDPVGMRTRARAVEGGWVLNGSKEFITSAATADVFIVMARTGEAPPALGCFIVEREDAGLSAGAPEDLSGLRGVSVGGLTLEGCLLDAQRLIGGEAGGFRVLGATGSYGMLGAAAAAVGIAAAALQETKLFAQERILSGTPLASRVGVQATLGALQGELKGAKDRIAQAIAQPDPPRGAPVGLIQAKVSATEAAVRIVDACQPLFGAMGYSRAQPIERRVRDVRGFRLHWGNNGVMSETLRKAFFA